mmetsp:Transcript_19804/g.32471  ORF Transcript_19804/g.32471 Transcript_19804/m.32471 type:complete len:109 (+) Transcript_19804:195-521(+)
MSKSNKRQITAAAQSKFILRTFLYTSVTTSKTNDIKHVRKSFFDDQVQFHAKYSASTLSSRNLVERNRVLANIPGSVCIFSFLDTISARRCLYASRHILGICDEATSV